MFDIDNTAKSGPYGCCYRLFKILTVIKRSLKDGRSTWHAVAYACEGQNLDLIEDVLSQTSELNAVCGISLHRPEPQSSICILFLVDHLKDTRVFLLPSQLKVE